MMALAMLGLASAGGCKANKNVATVPPQEFRELYERDSTALLIDVRRAEEFAEGHLQGAMLIDWLRRDEFEKEAARLDRSKTLYIYCRSGRRSSEAAERLAELGFRVVDMQGGYLAWTEAGMGTTPKATE